MRLLHLSDLHLGRRLCEADLFDDQRHILDQIVSIALSEGVQGVLVAGDVYDKGVPGGSALPLAGGCWSTAGCTWPRCSTGGSPASTPTTSTAL